jgi:hypothetical protein
MIATEVKKSRRIAELIQPVIADAIMILCFKFQSADIGRIAGVRVNACYKKDFFFRSEANSTLRCSDNRCRSNR